MPEWMLTALLLSVPALRAEEDWHIANATRIAQLTQGDFATAMDRLQEIGHPSEKQIITIRVKDVEWFVENEIPFDEVID